MTAPSPTQVAAGEVEAVAFAIWFRDVRSEIGDDRAKAERLWGKVERWFPDDAVVYREQALVAIETLDALRSAAVVAEGAQ